MTSRKSDQGPVLRVWGDAVSGPPLSLRALPEMSTASIPTILCRSHRYQHRHRRWLMSLNVSAPNSPCCRRLVAERPSKTRSWWYFPTAP
jgi:hypothetical protein